MNKAFAVSLRHLFKNNNFCRQIMETLFAINNQLLELTSTAFIRSMMDDIPGNERLVSLRGSRGVGKTTLLLQYQKLNYGINNRKALYAQLDGIYFTQHTLFELAERFYQQGGEMLLLDEVHCYPHWSKEIKAVYDTYPSLRIVFTGSSLLQIFNAEADLSRRCLTYTMQGLSYREYLRMFHDLDIPRCSLDDILTHATDICSSLFGKFRPLQHFNDYLLNGYYPFRKESPERYQMRLTNVVDMILNVELPLVCGVEIGNVRRLKALLVVMASQVPLQVDVSKLAALAGVSRNTLLAYLQYMQRAGLIRLLYSDELSVKKMQKPDKILLENTNLMRVLSLSEPDTGTLRETFFCNQLGSSHQIEYSQQGDFLIDRRFTFEVGGKAKDGRQIAGKADAYIGADNLELPAGNKLPLWLFGLLY